MNLCLIKSLKVKGSFKGSFPTAPKLFEKICTSFERKRSSAAYTSSGFRTMSKKQVAFRFSIRSCSTKLKSPLLALPYQQENEILQIQASFLGIFECVCSYTRVLFLSLVLIAKVCHHIHVPKLQYDD